MEKNAIASGNLRMSQLTVGMIEAAEAGDKDRLIKLAKHFVEDSGDFVGLLLQAANVTDEDMARHEVDDEELLKDASSASQIRTASVKS